MGSVVGSLEAAADVAERTVAAWVAGTRAKGEFRCAGCGYGVTVYRALPTCPMCQGASWERTPARSPASPYTRSLV
jgi:rubrerythrin